MRRAFFHGAVFPIDEQGYIHAESEYEPEEITQARQLFERTDRVLVAGGGMGWVALHVAARTAYTLLVEPLPALCQLLRDNVHVDDTPMAVLGGAIGGATRDAYFAPDGLWALSRLGVAGAAAMPVVVHGINDLVQRYQINALALDVEGAEVEILASLDPRPIDRILVEIHNFLLPDWHLVVQRLEDKGYIEAQSHTRFDKDGERVIIKSYVHQRHFR